MHTHVIKAEDIINRGGATLVVELYGSATYGNTIFSGSVRLNVRDNANASVDGMAVFSSIHGDLA